jgi:hypothetical protein
MPKISDLTAASALAGTEIVPVVQSATTKKATVADIAALAGGSPGMNLITRSGSYYSCGQPFTFTQNTNQPLFTVSTSVVYAFPFSVSQNITIDTIGHRQNTSNTLKMGIYSSNATTGLPDTLLNSATLSAVTDTAMSQSLTKNTIYWLAGVFSNAGSAYLVDAQYILGHNVSNNYCGVTCTGSYAGGLPSTFGTPSLVSLTVAPGGYNYTGPLSFYVKAA